MMNLLFTNCRIAFINIYIYGIQLARDRDATKLIQYNTSTATGCNRIDQKLQQKLSLRPKKKQACLCLGHQYLKTAKSFTNISISKSLIHTTPPLCFLNIYSTIDTIKGFHSSPHNFSMSSPQFLAFSDAAPSLEEHPQDILGWNSSPLKNYPNPIGRSFSTSIFQGLC